MSSESAPPSEREIADGMALGHEMHALVSRLFPICRSITGEGRARDTSNPRRVCAPGGFTKCRGGTKVFDWTVPQEWNIRIAYVDDEQGKPRY